MNNEKLIMKNAGKNFFIDLNNIALVRRRFIEGGKRYRHFAFYILHFTLIALAFGCFSLPAAAVLNSGSYTIPALILSSGGATEMSSGSYKLMDSKGQPVAGEISSTGYVMQTGGVYALVVAPVGTVPLTISRVGFDIKIGWPADTPDIYYLPSSLQTALGIYDNSVGWIKVLDGKTGSIVAGILGFTPDVANKNIKHTGQVGKTPADGAIPEVYYKGLVAGASKDEYLPQAPAVGKVDVGLLHSGLGYNYVSIPFNYINNQIKDVLDTAYLPVGTLVFSQLDGFNFDIAEVNPSKVWVSAFEASKSTDIGPNFYVKPESSYMIKVPSDTTTTVVGNVLRGTEGRVLKIQGTDHPGRNLYTYFGNFYPVRLALSDETVNDAAHLKLAENVAEGDRTFYPTDTSFNFNIAYYKEGRWRNEFDPTKTELSNITLQLPFGYMYKRNGKSFNWTK